MPSPTFFNLPEDKRSILLEILLDEFAANDYKNVSVARIAARAGIAKGSFYQYFADKKDCYLYLVQLALDEKKSFLRHAPPPEEALDLFARQRWLLSTGARFEFGNPRLGRILYRAIFDDVPLPQAILALIRRGDLEYYRHLFQQGSRAGEVRPEVDPEMAAFLYNVVFTNLGRHLRERFDTPPAGRSENGRPAFDQEQVRRAIDQALEILERGLRSQPGS